MSGNVTESFFSLLRLGLMGGNVPQLRLSPQEWALIHEISRRQAVQGVVFDALKQLPEGAGVPAELSAGWLAEVHSAEVQFARIARVIEVQGAAWLKRGIRAVQLKGHTLAAMYPVPEHRICGDVDWWFPEPGDWDKALAAVRENGLKINVDSDGDVNYSLGGVTVEHHRRGLASEDPVGILLMLHAHILHHAMVSGIGMRQFCDLAVAYGSLAGKYERTALEAALRREGLLKWSRVADAVLDRVFGTSFGGGAAERDVRRMLEMIMEDGNFGTARKHRFGGFHARAALFMKLAPGQFVRRWAGLVAGRIRRIFAR